MSVTDRLYKSIIKGKEGRNIGLSTGIPKVDSIVYGVQRGYVTVVAADSGAGSCTISKY